MYKTYNHLVNSLSFSEELYKLQRELNRKIDTPEPLQGLSQFHPLGISKQFQKRRISIAEAYLTVINFLDSGSRVYRLRSLKRLMEVAFHARTIAMPLNTARLQILLMKEAVKNRSNPRRQLELLYDFSRSSPGKHQIIRKLCDELNIPEVPENGKKLKNMNLGWDSHVHDTASTGRKNPTQLIIDAFIKGISRLTIAYYNVDSHLMMEEALEAGRIAGVRVDVAIEFDCMVQGKAYNFMALLPPMDRATDLQRFLKERGTLLNDFFVGLRENQKNRLKTVKKLVDNFNHSDLKELNAPFPDSPLYRIPKISKKKLKRFISVVSLNKYHIGEYFYTVYKPILHNRLLYTKAFLEKARDDFRKHLITEWNLSVAEQKFKQLEEEYRNLSPMGLQNRFFSKSALGESETVFKDIDSLASLLKKADCKIRLLRPLEYGLEGAKRLILDHGNVLDQVEIYNLQDSIHRDPEEFLQFSNFISNYNEKAQSGKGKPLRPIAGSDTKGRNPKIPGMGFIFEDRLLGKYKNKYIKRHITLPPPVSRLIYAADRSSPEKTVIRDPRLICMGKISEGYYNKTGLEKEESSIPLGRALRYVNPSLINLSYVLAGFVIALQSIGLFYSLVWFGITTFRNAIADLMASRGIHFKDWKIHSVDFANIARSLFWTGVSVPVLGYVKKEFDVLWPFLAGGLAYNFAKYSVISLSNSLYIVAHNTIRGFDRTVIRANFFRSIIALPLATIFAPVGDLLRIPSIVQAKFWSDTIGGIIEGTAKYVQVLKLQRRDVMELLSRIESTKPAVRYPALLDLLKLYRDYPRSRTSLKKIFKNEGQKTYRSLLELVQNPLLYPQLVEYILGSTSQDMSAPLVKLITETYSSFADWIGSYEKQIPQEKSPSAGAKGNPSASEKPKTDQP